VDKVREVALTTSIIGKGIGKTLPNVFKIFKKEKKNYLLYLLNNFVSYK